MREASWVGPTALAITSLIGFLVADQLDGHVRPPHAMWQWALVMLPSVALYLGLRYVLGRVAQRGGRTPAE